MYDTLEKLLTHQATLMTVVVIAFVMGVCAYLILLERWIAAWVQDRFGPNRVGPFGLLQPVADGGKMFLKEDFVPSHVDRVFFFLAPFIAFSSALIAAAVVPFGAAASHAQPAATLAEFRGVPGPARTDIVLAPSVDIGLLAVLAIGSLAVYSVILAGWSANNKYSLLGSLRSSAQIISYEIPMGTSLIPVFLTAGSLNLEAIMAYQQVHGWFVLYHPVCFLVFMTCVFAECNRLPFDLPEAEQELVGGYHTEYSNSMKLGLMLLSEYAHMITTSFIMSIVFFGGTKPPFFAIASGSPVWDALLGTGVLLFKMSCFLVLFLLVRWTIPRFKFDQLIDLAWKVLIPLTLAILLGVILLKAYAPYRVLLPVLEVGVLLAFAGVSLAQAARQARRPYSPAHSRVRRAPAVPVQASAN